MFSKFVSWTPKSLAKWEQKRHGGKRRYIWRDGVLGWGVPMFIVMTSFMYVQKFGPVWPSIGDLPVSLILINAVLWPIGGYWFGATMWSTMERAYQRYQGETSS